MNKDSIDAILRALSDLPEFSGLEKLEPNSKGRFGNAPLHIAAIRGDVLAVQLLLDAGADPNVQGENSYTPLHDAAEQGHECVVKVLLQRGADRTVRNAFGELPSDLIVAEEQDEFANHLKQLLQVS